MAAQCGGTVTVQKQIIGETADGLWTYSTNTGDSTLDLDLTSSLTFDFTFARGESARDVIIHEAARHGYTFSHAACTSGGVPIDGSNIIQNPDDVPGVLLTIEPDQAVSCTMFSNPE
jgi:hypothetical protein